MSSSSKWPAPPTATKQRSPPDWILDIIGEVLHGNTEQDDTPDNDSTNPSTNTSQSEQIDKKQARRDAELGDYSIPLDVFREEIRQGYKTATEKTTTSPSGRHLGHYKTLLADNDFAEFFITQCTLPVQHGFAQTDGSR